MDMARVESVLTKQNNGNVAVDTLVDLSGVQSGELFGKSHFPGVPESRYSISRGLFS